MTRLFDLIALVIVAVVVLLPRPSIQARPAVEGDQTDLERLAQLEDAHALRQDAATAVELARAYLQVEQPAWALAALQPHLARGPYQAHQVAAFAYATLLRPADALREAEAGLAACEADPGCSGTARIRLSYIAELMRKPVAAGVDPKKDPLAAKRAIAEALHATRVPAATDAPQPAAGKGSATPQPAPRP